MVSRAEPLRGEVWLIDFGMAAKVRPAVVITVPYDVEDRALIGVVPHTTSLRGANLEIPVNPPFLHKKGAFMLQGFATLPPRHFIRHLGTLKQSEMGGHCKRASSLGAWQGL